MQDWNINRGIQGEGAKLLRRKATMPRDIGKHLFRTLSGKAPYGSTDDRTKRKNSFVNGNQIDYITRCPSVRGSGSFVGGEVHRMEHVAEKFITLGREKAKVTVRNPLKQHHFIKTFDQNRTLAGLRFKTCQNQACISKNRYVGSNGRSDSFFGILKNIDIAGKPGSLPVESYPSGNIAVRAAVSRQQLKHVGLQPSERHGTTLLSVLPDADHPYLRGSEAPG